MTFHTSCLKTGHLFCFSALIRIFSNWGSLGKDISYIHNLLEGDHFQNLTFFFPYCLFCIWQIGRGWGDWVGNRSYVRCQEIFWLWKFIFHIPIWEHKREAWSSLQKENKWNSCAVCRELESFAKRIWAYIRFGSYLSMMRPESSNSDKKKCSVHQYSPNGDFTPSNGIWKMNPLVIFLKPFYIL